MLRLCHPSIAVTLLRDKLGWLRRAAPTPVHLHGTMRWLCRAQDVVAGGGVAAGYSVVRGWLPAYPETTGYIIPTFLNYCAYSGLEEYRERARRMADWETEIQLPDGAVRGGVLGQGDNRPVVFNTGQVLLGWCRASTEFQDVRHYDAAVKAGDWLVRTLSPDGSWNLPGAATETTVHAYDARTAWSLLALYQLTSRALYRDAALRNLAWTLAQQHANGWFENNAFFSSKDRWSTPLTHTISYVMEGLLESWKILLEADLLEAAKKTADRLLHIYETRRFMAGEFDSDWKGNRSFSCLTGNAQIAGVWLALFEITDDARYLNAALKLSDYVKSTQALSSLNSGIAGGVKGSQPLFGKYTRFTYVNWGAKFLADTLMLEERIMNPLESAAKG